MTDLSPPAFDSSADQATSLQEAEAIFRVAGAIAGSSDLQSILDTSVSVISDALGVHATAIRLLEVNPETQRQRLVLKSTFNMPEVYRQQGILALDDIGVLGETLEGRIVFVDDLRSDPRVRNPKMAREAGVVSMMGSGIHYKGHPLGTLQVFTQEPRNFSLFEIKLIRSIGQLLGVAIRNAQLESHRQEHRELQRQLRLAAAVQQRLLPEPPVSKELDLAARYVPSLDLAGDFYDFICLNGHTGIAIGDVVGKGVPASLLMATVRASLRAYAHETYDLDQIISKVNDAMTRDTRDHEFATLFYGVVDPRSGRLTYCNAGHEPLLIYRKGEILRLITGGMVIGAVPELGYEKGIFDLEPGDVMLLFTDGLSEAMNFQDQQFGRQRVLDAFKLACQDPTAQAASILNHILWEKRRFVGLREAMDDTTLIVARYYGPGGPPQTNVNTNAAT